MQSWFAKELRDIMKERKLTVCELAEQAQVSEHNLRLHVAGRTEPTIDIAERILKAMGYELDVVAAAQAVTKAVEPPKAQEDSYCWNCGSEGTLVDAGAKQTRCNKCGVRADA